MTMHLGDVPAGITLYIPFATYDGATGASETCSGLAVTDVEIYKNGSVTQRSSDAGYALLDTDGIDFDSLTGINGFSVDLSDNTDAGFFSVGGFYWVIVSSITADTQTVNFIAATFRIVAAESTAGYPQVDTARVANTAQTAGDLAALITTVDTVVDRIEVDTQDLQTQVGTAGAGLTNINLPDQTMNITGNITGNLSGSVGSVTGAVGSVTGNVGGNVTGSVGSVAAGGITASSFGAGAVDAAALAADAGAELADALLNRDMSTGTDSGSATVRTPRQALRLLRNKASIAAGTLTVTKEDDTTASWTGAVTTTAGDPISAIDPASA